MALSLINIGFVLAPGVVMAIILLFIIKPRALFFVSCLMGVLYFFLALAIQSVLPSVSSKESGPAVRAFLATAIPEEALKWIFCLLTWRIFRSKNLLAFYKIGSACVIGLLFAVMENVYYDIYGWHMLAMRTASALPLHLSTSILTALFPWGVVASALFHGFYDLLMGMNIRVILIGLVLNFGVFVIFITIFIRKKPNKNDKEPEKITFF